MAQLSTPPGINLLRQEDLKKDLYFLADAHFNGRSAGTLDELKASMWLGEQFKKIGLKPAGEDGTYFQFFTLWRNVVSQKSKIEIDNIDLKINKDVLVAQMAEVSIDEPIFYMGNALDIDTNKIDIKGKVVAMQANAKGINLDVSLPTWRYHRYIFARYGAPLLRKGAIAIIFINDEIAENAWQDASENFKRGSYDIEGGPNEQVYTKTPVLWLPAKSKDMLKDNTSKLHLNLVISKYPYPSVNVIGKTIGTDKILNKEYILFSGHSDAHGIRNMIKNDSIYYGADDNASVDVAMLANARAFVKYPSKRSVLFVIHGAEERGLLGSKFYSAHSTIPLSNIIAVLNGDMIGRNHSDSAALLGVNPPHLNSKELVNMAFAANAEGPKFIVDTTWDNANHIEGWYFRSDHLPYARLGIPSIMYSTLLHSDYHTPQDNADNINYPKLKKMTEWMYRTAWKIGNAKQRPALEKSFRLER
ncbi:MAG: hypothetical protein NVS9B7_18150 [Flavisolibacter sp.]